MIKVVINIIKDTEHDQWVNNYMYWCFTLPGGDRESRTRQTDDGRGDWQADEDCFVGAEE